MSYCVMISQQITHSNLYTSLGGSHSCYCRFVNLVLFQYIFKAKFIQLHEYTRKNLSMQQNNNSYDKLDFDSFLIHSIVSTYEVVDRND